MRYKQFKNAGVEVSSLAVGTWAIGGQNYGAVDRNDSIKAIRTMLEMCIRDRYRREPVLDALMFAVALAVAAIPEALGSIVTIVQAMGTQKMAKEHAVIKLSLIHIW